MTDPDPDIDDDRRIDDATADAGLDGLLQAPGYKVLGELDVADDVGVLGRNTATTGGGHGVAGVTNGSGVFDFGEGVFVTASGVYGEATHEEPTTTAGVRGINRAINDGNPGVEGFASSLTGTAFGVTGEVRSRDGDSTGVFGKATAGTGRSYGVFGRSDSAEDEAAGVVGYSKVGSGQTYGVQGVTDSNFDGAAGVRGEIRNVDGFGSGVRGTTKGVGADFGSIVIRSHGVYGEATSTTGVETSGVTGINHSSVDDNAGVRGQAVNGSGRTYGVAGSTQSDADGAAGVRGDAPGGGAIENYGVYGVTGASGDRLATPERHPAGVKGLATGGNLTHGVVGEVESRYGRGVVGLATTDSYSPSTLAQTPIGVLGVTDYTGAAGDVYRPYAVRAKATAGSGETYGVYASTRSTDGYASYGFASATTGTNYAVYGNTNSTGGFGVYSSGRLYAAETLSNDAGDPSGHVATIRNDSGTGSGDVLLLESGNADPGTDNHFVTFADPGGTVGSIRGDGGGGVEFTGSTADFAEWFPKADPDERFEPGEVVGLRGGEVVSPTDGADAAFVVSTAPLLSGNEPRERDRERYVRLSLVGQVPVHVDGPVESGARLVAAGGDRVAIPASECDRDPGSAPVVGVALEGLSTGGPGEVLALVGVPDGPAARARGTDPAGEGGADAGRDSPPRSEDDAPGRDGGGAGDRIDAQAGRIADLEAELDRKDRQIATLADRLASLEASVDGGERTSGATADD